MTRAHICSLFFAAALWGRGHVQAGEPTSRLSDVLQAGELPHDARLKTARGRHDAYHPWSPPVSKSVWEKQSRAIRRRVLVSNGLWPMPPKTALNPVIHGKIDRGEYTIEKVFFASLPGHYVTGNLYRPKNVTGKLPGVLCPHGHWPDGRFYDAGVAAAKKLIASGGESLLSAARHHVQARMVGLARMGCVVFHYDMVGYGDSWQTDHTVGFTDVQAALWLQNFMGLQTWNSIRALDFLASLPEVDETRIGVTGASGGGTQTFILCAIDPRPAAAFPAVMVSTGMQGGCICENASYLRIGINNIAIAALFAPKPLAMSGADDWTKQIETKGLPELKQVYALYGKLGNVTARAYPQYQHNFNQITREMMYQWFNQHLDIGLSRPYREQDFQPATRQELTVFNDRHPLPPHAVTIETLREYLTARAKKQFFTLLPKRANDVARYRRVVGTAAKVMLDAGIPDRGELAIKTWQPMRHKEFTLHKSLVDRKGTGEQIPVIRLIPPDFAGEVVLWIDQSGKSALFDDSGKPIRAVKRLLDAHLGVAGADVFLTGEFLKAPAPQQPQYPQVDAQYAGFTFGFNRPLLSSRVRDILTVLAVLIHDKHVETIHLIGTGEAGVWTLLAKALAGDRVDHTVVDARGFGFSSITSMNDPMMLPGALRYGGLGGLAALAAPAKLTVAGTNGIPSHELSPLLAVYQAVGGELTIEQDELTAEQAVQKLLDSAD